MSKHLNNKGFSLLELLVVVAIFGVMAGFSALTLAMINNGDVNKAAYNYNSALDTSKVQCMAKGAERGEIILSKRDGGLYYRMGEETDYNKICTRNIKFQVEYKDGSLVEGDSLADNTDFATISFNSAGMVINDPGSPTVRAINFMNGNRKVSTILYGETGKHEVKPVF